MSLTVLLAILGGIVLAAVVIHGAWQTRKAGPKRAEQKGGAQDSRPANDSRLNTGLERIEPSLDFGAGEALAPPSRPSPEADSAASTTSLNSPSHSANPKRLLLRQELRLDALIDAIAPISLEAPISGELLLSHLPASRRAGSKPMRVEGLNADTGEWEFALPGQRYSEVQAGVQLANRTGAMNNIEFSEFAQKVQTLADLIGGMADMPDMLEETARARELDAFASAHDAQLAVHLRARAAAWSVGYIVQHAGRHGFVPGVLPGRLVLAAHEEGAPPILTLTFDAQAALADDPQQAAVRDVTLSFDVPQTAREAQPFAAWQASAQALSLGMDASIVDDNGQSLSGEGFAAIGHELERLYEALAQRDMAAGSALARRLFS